MGRPNLVMFLFIAEGCIVLNGFPLCEFRDKNRPDLVLLTWTEFELGCHHRKLTIRFRHSGGWACSGEDKTGKKGKRDNEGCFHTLQGKSRLCTVNR